MTRRIRNIFGAAAAIAVVALLPATASASQVMWEDGMARYKASGGEDNVVKATLNSTGKKVTFQDSGAVIWNAGPGCQIDNDHQATCTKATGIPGVWIGTGSSDDSVQANLGAKLLRLRVALGSDEDTLSVTGTGYYGDLHGNGGDDTIADGNGSSAIYGDENLGGNDVIDGGGANDVIYAGKGADDITGGAGNDRIHAQQGNDVIHAVDGAADAVLGCGPDADTIHVDPQDVPSADCETVL